MDLERVCLNQTPLAARCFALDDRHGRDVLVTIAKLSFGVSASGVAGVLPEQRDLRFYDLPTTGKRWSSVRYPSDFAEEKPGTDVILVGTGHPPADRSATAFQVSLRVETGKRTIEKSLTVHGPRVFFKSALGVVPGPAAAPGPTPLVYELAWGGVDDSDPSNVLVEWRNPAGIGVARDRAALVGQRAPQLEDPRDALGARTPASFGAIAAHWAPRSDRVGTYDDAWRRERAPVRPADFDPRHFSAAHPDLWSPEPLVGDEAIEVLGATPERVWRFRLPRFRPRFHASIAGVVTELATHLDTLLVDADARVVELTWRAAVRLPSKTQLVDGVRISGEGALPPWERVPEPPPRRSLMHREAP